MDSIAIDKSISYKTNSSINKDTNSVIDNKHPDKNSNSEIVYGKDASDISNDAVISYKFLNRIEASTQNSEKGSFVEKYIGEYERIKKEIDSGLYGNNTNKFTSLLDNAFKNVIDNSSDLLIKSSEKSSKVKMTSSSLIKCQKQYENATSLVWIYRAENKRVLQEIEDYRRKKNHQMVASLTRLSNAYKHVINNISNTVAMIQQNIDDSFSTDSDESSKVP